MDAYREPLGDGLVLRTIQDDPDIERYAALNALVGGPSEGTTSARLIRHHPETHYGDFLLVEDERTGRFVSTTCLIPWHCCYEGVPLDVAMLEMVVTHPEYRHRGLVRAQIQRFHQMVRERGWHLSIIQGIPHYYRQFGYTYVLDHYGCDSLPAGNIPQASAGDSHYRLRPATTEDVPALARLYDTELRQLQFGVLRDEAYWRYLLTHVGAQVRLLEDARDGHAAGYLHATALSNRLGFKVQESAAEDYTAGLAILQMLKAETPGEIQVAWPEVSTLLRIARSLGSKRLLPYQWLVRIPDIAAWLTTLRPVLERRLASSACAGLSADLTVNLYREAYTLHFRQGCLEQVEPRGFVDASMHADGGDLCLPADAFVRLVLGYRDLDTLRDAWPDIMIKPGRRYLFDVLFPRMASYVHMPY